MGVFDSLPGDNDRDGYDDYDGDDFDNDGNDDGGSNDDGAGSDGRDRNGSSDDGADSDGRDRNRDQNGDQRRRRNRPGSQVRSRNEVRSLRAQLDTLTKLVQDAGLAVNVGGRNSSRGNGNGNGNGNGQQNIDVDALRRQLAEEIRGEIEGKANARVLRTEASSALREAGFRGDARRGVRMLDLEGIDPDDNDALLDAIDDLKDSSPELFGRVRRSRPRDRDDDDSDEGYRPRERQRSTRSREGMSRSRDVIGGREQDGLAADLSRLVGGSDGRDGRR